MSLFDDDVKPVRTKNGLILSHEDALYVSNYFKEYYDGFGKIEDYLRRVKLERMGNIPTMLPGMSIEDDMFTDFTMNPNDMDIDIRLADQRYNDYLQVVTSHAIDDAPYRRLKLMVFEKNTNNLIGFIRIGTCTINSAPRAKYLGRPLNTYDMDEMKRFNNSACMGVIIVPTQPFGYNYLGGKLLAGICCSHWLRRVFNEKYNLNLCHFETTSLYGSTKSSSQYDGMKPYLRQIGLTDSDFPPLLNDQKFLHLKHWFKRRNGEALKTTNSSIKMSLQSIMVSITKNSLKEYNEEDYLKFCKIMDDAKDLTEQKRVYVSDYGYSNAVDYILGNADQLEKKPNFDRFELENVIDWWKKMATKRYNKLQSEGRLRTELELWNKDASVIDIIR